MPSWPHCTSLTGAYRPHTQELEEGGWQEEDQGSWTSSKPRPSDCPRTSDHCVKKSPGKGPSRTACWSSPQVAEVQSRVKDDWSRHALGVLCVNPTARLAMDPWEQRSCSEAPPSSPAPQPPTPARLREPHGRAPTVGRPVLAGALANKSPALMSGARRCAANFSQDGQEDTPRKSSGLPSTCWSGPWASFTTCVAETGAWLVSDSVWGPDLFREESEFGFPANFAKPTPAAHTRRQAASCKQPRFSGAIPCRRIHRDRVVDGCFPAKERLPGRRGTHVSRNPSRGIAGGVSTHEG